MIIRGGGRKREEDDSVIELVDTVSSDANWKCIKDEEHGAGQDVNDCMQMLCLIAKLPTLYYTRTCN